MSRAELLLRAKGESETLHGLRTDSETQHFTHQASVSSHTYWIHKTQSHLRGVKGKTKRQVQPPQISPLDDTVSPGSFCLFAAPGPETVCFTGLYLPKGPAKGRDSGSQKQLTFQAAANQTSGTSYNTSGRLYKLQPSTQKNQGEQRIWGPSKSFQWLRPPKGKDFSVLGSRPWVYKHWITQIVLNVYILAH